MHRLFLIIALFSWIEIAVAQSLNVGTSFCASNYSGDLTRDNASVLRQTKPGFGLALDYWLDELLGFSVQYECLHVSADDALSEVEWQKKRNLNFSSPVYSSDLLAQINLSNIFLPHWHRVKMKLIGGYGFFRFKPTARWNDKEYSLRELGTEGQGMVGYRPRYSLHSTALNFGWGMEVNISAHWIFSSQILFRKTNTDYLDDISNSYVDYATLAEQNGLVAAELGNKIKAPQGSQRGNPVDNDWYQSVSIGFKYKIFDKLKRTQRVAKNHIVHCPTIR